MSIDGATIPPHVTMYILQTDNKLLITSEKPKSYYQKINVLT